ncbi:MAG: cupin domain-containing protein [Pseudomonadales bacterium]|nr:cupin domain-containing protein [Pseudomonadales bacterium]
MNSGIKKFQIDSEYFFKEGCFITEVSNSSDDEEVSVARARVEPGKKTKWHALADTAERYVILEGSGTVEIGDMSPSKVTAGDVVLIPPQMRQRIFNSGENDLIFLAICSPRFEQKNYLEVE